MIDVSCTKCSKRYRVGDSYGGKKVRCKACGQAMTIPAPEPEDFGEIPLADDPMWAGETQEAPPYAPVQVAPPYKPPPSPATACGTRTTVATARPRKAVSDDQPYEYTGFPWAIIGPPDWSIYVFGAGLVAALISMLAPGMETVQIAVAALLIGVFLIVAGTTWGVSAARKAGYEGIMAIGVFNSLIIFLHLLWFALADWYSARKPIFCILRGVLLLVLVIGVRVLPAVVNGGDGERNDRSWPRASSNGGNGSSDIEAPDNTHNEKVGAYILAIPDGMKRQDGSGSKTTWRKGTKGNGEWGELTVEFSDSLDNPPAKPIVITEKPADATTPAKQGTFTWIGAEQEEDSLGDIDCCRLSKDGEVVFVAIHRGRLMTIRLKGSEEMMDLLEESVNTIRQR